MPPNTNPAKSNGSLVGGTLSSLETSLRSVIEAGRDILASRGLSPAGGEHTAANLAALCRELLQHRGEASGLALASEVVRAYVELPKAQQVAFFQLLAADFEVDKQQVLAAAESYRVAGDIESLWEIARSAEAPRQKLFRRINMVPGGTRTLVSLRGDLLPQLRRHPELRGVDSDLKHLFISWFNKGFLELRRIDWSSPAAVLEKIIDYEAVHAIDGWDDLRARLHEDRRCFAFFHPALADDPLVFVEIALTTDMPSAIAPLLVKQRDFAAPRAANTVVFYSISNCHPGLAGVSFGNFLIKNVVEELRSEISGLKTFVTLSPVPGFRNWLLEDDLTGLVDSELAAKVKQPVSAVVQAEVYEALQRLCAHYLLKVKSGDMPRDPVARFHLGNGARLHRLLPGADMSSKGRQQSAGIMVNYLYDLKKIEVNHEAFFDHGKISVSRSVSRLLSRV